MNPEKASTIAEPGPAPHVRTEAVDEVGRIGSSGRYAAPACSAQVIPRGRLFERMAARTSTVIIGAAGYGKSALVSSWLLHSPPDGVVGWLTLDPSDGDPGRLAADLLAALQATAGGPLREAFREFEAPSVVADRLSFVDAIHDVLASSDVPLTLVLDDVHHVAGSRKALAVLDHLLLWLPPSAKVVIAARSVPGLRLQRLRLEGRLEVIGPEDLAFTRAETAAAVRLWGADLDTEKAVELHEVTKGWPAGVRMALLAKPRGTSWSLPTGLLSDDALAEYLTTEVLGSLDQTTRQFVIEGTIDERVCPSLLDAARGSDESVTLLEQCVRHGLFLTREPSHDDAGHDQWFRWHGLFAAHMRPRRRETTARCDELERRAAAWWRRRDPAVAVRHALAAHDGELAGQIAAEAWLELLLEGRGDTVEEIVAQVPREVSTAAELHLAMAFVASERGSFDRARAELGAARRASSRPGSSSRADFEIRAAMIELFAVGDRASLATCLAHGHRLMTEAGTAAGALDRPTEALVKLCVGVGEARLLDDPLAALRLLREAESSAKVAGYPALELMARAEQCIPSVATGQLGATRALAENVLATARAKGWGDLSSVAVVHGWLGWLALCEGDAAGARELIEHCMANLRPNDWGMFGLTTTYHAQACVSLGDVEAASRDMCRARELARHGRMPAWWPSLLAALEATVLATTGRIEEAMTIVDEPTEGPDYYLATCYRANVLLRGDRPDRTLEVLETFPAHRMYPHVAGLVEGLRAQALVETGDETGAHAALERALASAEEFDLVGPLLMVGDRITSLLDAHLAQGTSHHDLALQVRSRLAASSAVNDWGETLTKRELDILQYFATDLSQLEIAEAEFISVNTVKSHAAHVYQKLGVDNRRAAVRRSAELGLL